MAVSLAELVRDRVRVLDGAWGTELHKRGLAPGACPDLWNVDRPEAVEAVARSYVEAGSEIILTNTFGSNRFVLAGWGAEDRVAELAEAGTAISRAAAEGTDVKVFASIGPTGKIVMMEEVAEEKLAAAFAEAAEAVSWAGADAVVLESFGELAELKIALRAVRHACDLPAVASMTFDAGPDKTSTMMGNKPSQLVAAAEAGGASAVGANCGVGPEQSVRVAAMLRAAGELPIWIKPNAGLPQADKRGRTTFPMGPDAYAAHVGELIAAGANFIGGCCGTTPQHVRAIRAAVAEVADPS